MTGKAGGKAVMLKELFRSISKSEEADRLAAEDRYVVLLENGDADTAEELRTVMAAIGKTAADLPIDDALLTRARKLQTAIDQGCKLSKPLGEAIKARNEYADETQRIIRERTERAQELSAAAQALNDRRRNAQDSERELRQLSVQHPALLRTVGILTFQE